MSIMTGERAVVAALKELKAIVTIPVYKYEKLEGYNGDYIAVNHLPFPHTEDVENGIVNVNVHVPKLRTNQPNTKRLAELVELIISSFPFDTNIDGFYFYFLTDSRPSPDNDNTYYINLRFNVIYNNLN